MTNHSNHRTFDDRSDAGQAQMRRRLDHVAAAVDVGELETARAAVADRVGRRRTRKRVGAALGAVAAITLATAGVLTIGGDDPDTLVTSDDVEVPATDAESTESTLELAPPTGRQPVELIDGAARVVSSAGTDGAPEYGEWMVPWEDGFLVGSLSFPPQPLPDELPEEVLALFPPEVIEVFGGDLPATISEATERLSDAGLLDVVSQIIQDNPEAYDAIYGAPSNTAPTLDVRFTVDGVTWEPREMVLPAGADYLSNVTAAGDRIAAVYSISDPLTGMPIGDRVIVASTTDLVTWTTQDIVLTKPGDLPEGVTWSTFPASLVANDDAWVVSLFTSINVDPLVLLPAEVSAEIDSEAGYGLGTDDAGISILLDLDENGENPGRTLTYTWAELGISPEVAQLILDQDFTPEWWTSSWDGTPTPAAAPPMHGLAAATPSGFVIWTDRTWFSPDGVTWADSALPGDAMGVSGAFAIDGGLIVVAQGDGGDALVYRLDERGGDAVALELADVPAGSFSAVGPMSGSGAGSATAGMIVDLAAAVPDEALLSVEVDGYRLTALQPSGIFEVVELSTGEVVVSEAPFGPGGAASGSIRHRRRRRDRLGPRHRRGAGRVPQRGARRSRNRVLRRRRRRLLPGLLVARVARR